MPKFTSRLSFFDTRKLVLNKIYKKGGWVNSHSHLDRAYTITPQNFHLGMAWLAQKWELVDEIKRNSTVNTIYDRMAYGLENMIAQKVQAIGIFIDVDDVIKDKSIKAAIKIKVKYGKDIKIKFINQVLKGVVNNKARYWFTLGAEFADIIGGLPGKDKGREEEHIDILLETAKKMNKMVHVHVDQLNTQTERETELLAQKTIEHKMIGKVVAIHSVSLSAHKKEYRDKIYKLMKEAKLMIISCPSAWIDNRRTEILTPTHNSIAPVEELVLAGIDVAIGTDNIFDIYKPFLDGDMWTELRFLLESCHFYDVDALVDIATINGFKVLGLD